MKGRVPLVIHRTTFLKRGLHVTIKAESDSFPVRCGSLDRHGHSNIRNESRGETSLHTLRRQSSKKQIGMLCAILETRFVQQSFEALVD